MKRWVAVAGVWAIAATAIAVIALLDNGDKGSQKVTDDLTRQVASFQRRLDDRLAAVEQKVDAAPSNEDVTKLENRLSSVEDDVQQAVADAERADHSVTELEDRVQSLEDAADSILP